ncbi:S41 family peptidase [Mycoplasma miroungirhinis]|uniref:Peptidase S41 n=1 Tax=Mycoplasma miroungirhinis TaxID=754516 RepID=A0A6M4JE57_9MOLU|nr:S41 family peptidase [Mycoplasma miroungirhinis]QJR44377.1 peptidase S41 [Mycoplasma miroungirhinis]
MRKHYSSKKFIKKLITYSFLTTISAAAISAAVSCSTDESVKITTNIPEELKSPTNNTSNESIKETNNNFKSVTFENISSEYNISNTNLKIFKNQNTDDIYVNVNEFINKLNGLFLKNQFKYIKHSKLGYEYSVFNSPLIFDDINNKILFQNTNVFNFLESSSTINYTERIKYLENNEDKLTNDKYSELDLGKYNFKILEKDKNIFLPFSIFNLLFLSQGYYNIYYNGDKFIGTTLTINKDTSSEEYNKIMNNSNNDQKQTAKQRQNNYNFLLFLFDNFYGLKNNVFKKYNVTNWDEFFQTTHLKDKLLSPESNMNANAYEDFIYTYLDELHTSIQSGSYYDPKDYRANPYASAQSSTIQSYINNLNKLSRIRNATQAKNKENENDVNFLQFHNDIAIIYLDGFTIATNEEINGKEPYKYDSYFLMFEAMKRIQQHSTQHPIKKIILDISLNGGGSIAAMEKVAAFMSNKDQKIYYYDILSKILNFSKYRVDVNNDAAYDARDGYTNYDWYILVGKNTFSAANLLTHIAKLGKFAKIIGNKSGGGMYSILPVVLPDGTSLQMSSNNAWIAVPDKDIEKENDLPYTEDGIDVDLEIPYFAYYNYDVLEAYLQNPEEGLKKYNQYILSVKQSAWNTKYNNINKYLNYIKNKRNKQQYLKDIEEYTIQPNDTLDQMDEKIEKMKQLFNIIQHQYQSENRK